MRVGIATCDITPDHPILMSGYGPDRMSEGAYHPLSATCFVFDNGHTRVGFMALDILMVDDFILVPVRHAAARNGIAAEAFMMNSSHTHTGPVTERVRSPIRIFDDEYLGWFRDRLCGLVDEAVADLREATLDYSVGWCSLGISRRRPFNSGLLPNPEKPIDPDVPVLRILTPEGAIRGVVFSYACHLANNGGPLLGGDLACFARDYVEAKIPGCTTAFLAGCGGDVKARLLDPVAERFGGGEVPELKSVGEELGRAVCAALCGPKQPLGDALAADSEIIHLPFDHQPTEQELASAGDNPYFLAWAKKAREWIAEHGKLIEELPLEIQVLRLGDLYVACSAAETCVDIGLRLKRELPDLTVMTLGYSNGSWDYLATGEAFLWGNYEGTYSHMDTPYPWPKPVGLRPDADDIFNAQWVALVRRVSSCS